MLKKKKEFIPVNTDKAVVQITLPPLKAKQ